MSALASSPAPGAPVDAVVAAGFRALVEAQLGYVTSTLRRLGVREAEVLDQAQEVFLVVHTRLADYDPSRPLRPWLFGIAYHHACRFRALARHRREVLDDAPGDDRASDDAGGPEHALDAARRRALVLEALEGVEISRRAAFVLADIDGESAPDVALALGIPLNTVYSRLRLARADFADAVKRIQARRPASAAAARHGGHGHGQRGESAP